MANNIDLDHANLHALEVDDEAATKCGERCAPTCEVEVDLIVQRHCEGVCADRPVDKLSPRWTTLLKRPKTLLVAV